MANSGAPEEVLTDNGPQYKTWRGKSAFTALCERRGIKQIVARPRHPQTLGKIERFWGSLWRGGAQGAGFRGLREARAGGGGATHIKTTHPPPPGPERYSQP